jgi:hypothetical protein
VKYIKATFGLDMDPQYFSAIKSRLKGKEVAPKKVEQAKRGRKPKAAAPVAAAPPPKQPANGSQLDLIESLEALKTLVAQLGSDKVKRLVDLLG